MLFKKGAKDFPTYPFHASISALIVISQISIGYSSPNDFDLHAGIYLQIHEGSRTYTGNPGFHLLLTLSNIVSKLSRNGIIIAGITWACIAKIATYAISYKYIRTVTSKQLTSALISGAVCISIPLIDPIRILNFHQLLLGLLTPNVLHNPTTILSLPASLLLYLEVRKNDPSVPKALLFTLLTAFFKPAFLLSLAPALFICSVTNQTSRTSRTSRTKTAGISILIGCIIILQFILIFIYQLGIQPAEESAITLSKPFEVLAHYTSYKYVGIGLLCSLAFPISVAWTTRKVDKLSWANFIIALCIAAFIKETGPREFHGNFIWTAHIALFFLFLESGKAIIERLPKIPITFLAAHTLSGLIYPCWIVLFHTYK